MMEQGLNKLEGKPVQESKSLSERRLAQNKPETSASAPVAVKPTQPVPGASGPVPASAPAKQSN